MQPDPELAVAYGVFSVRQAKEAGHDAATIARHVRRGRWVRVERGILRSRGLLPQDELVLAVLRAGPGAVVSLRSAALVHGWDLRSRPKAPELITLPDRGRGSGYRTGLASSEVQFSGCLPVTTPRRTALDLAAALPFDEAVVAVDSALRAGVLLEDLQDLFAGAHRKGVRQARQVLSMADPLSGSVAETEARLLFTSSELPPFTTQHTVRTPFGLVRLDFAWEEALVAAEIDGFAYHSATGAFQRDRTRQNAVQLQGWLVLRFTVADIRERPLEVVAEVMRALHQRLPRR